MFEKWAAFGAAHFGHEIVIFVKELFSFCSSFY